MTCRDPLEPIWTNWNSLWDPLRSIWIFLDPLRFTGIHFVQRVSIGIYLNSLWSILIHKDPLGFIGIKYIYFFLLISPFKVAKKRGGGGKKMILAPLATPTEKKYRCYYPHLWRDSVSAVCRIFSLSILIHCDLFWFILINFDTFWSIEIHWDPLGSICTH